MIHALDGQAPEIDEAAWIAPGAHVIGRVRIGPGASVWFGAVLRGDNEWIEVGAGSNVQDNAVLHTDWGHPLVVGRGCTVGHQATLHGCTIGDGSLVGMSATILNGAAIGASSLVGAGSLVTEGKVFGERCLVMGSPARLAGALDDEAVADLARSALRYAENALRFAAGLTAS